MSAGGRQTGFTTLRTTVVTPDGVFQFTRPMPMG
jgi:hypothetical protein